MNFCSGGILTTILFIFIDPERQSITQSDHQRNDTLGLEYSGISSETYNRSSSSSIKLPVFLTDPLPLPGKTISQLT